MPRRDVDDDCAIPIGLGGCEELLDEEPKACSISSYCKAVSARAMGFVAIINEFAFAALNNFCCVKLSVSDDELEFCCEDLDLDNEKKYKIGKDVKPIVMGLEEVMVKVLIFGEFDLHKLNFAVKDYVVGGELAATKVLKIDHEYSGFVCYEGELEMFERLQLITGVFDKDLLRNLSILSLIDKLSELFDSYDSQIRRRLNKIKDDLLVLDEKYELSELIKHLDFIEMVINNNRQQIATLQKCLKGIADIKVTDGEFDDIDWVLGTRMDKSPSGIIFSIDGKLVTRHFLSALRKDDYISIAVR